MAHYLSNEQVLEIWEKKNKNSGSLKSVALSFYREATEKTWQVSNERLQRMNHNYNNELQLRRKLEQEITAMRRKHEIELKAAYKEGFADGFSEGRDES